MIVHLREHGGWRWKCLHMDHGERRDANSSPDLRRIWDGMEGGRTSSHRWESLDSAPRILSVVLRKEEIAASEMPRWSVARA